MNNLQQLAISDEGFIFNPSTGESFTVNQTGLAIIKGLKNSLSIPKITRNIMMEFDVDARELEMDITDFIDHLRIYRLH